MAKRKAAKVEASTPSRPRPSLTLARRKVSPKVGKRVTLLVTAKVTDESLGEEWERPKKPTKRIEVISTKEVRSGRRSKPSKSTSRVRSAKRRG